MKRYPFIKNCSIEIPKGWNKLVEQMLDDVAQVVDLSSNFEFIQIKEKYNELVAYPNVTIPEVEEVLSNYQALSNYVCVYCGAPATKFSKDYYIESFCDDCWKDKKRHSPCNNIDSFTTEYQTIRYGKGERTIIERSFRKEWDRLYPNENN